MFSKRFPLAALLVCAVNWADEACALPVITVFPEVAGAFAVDALTPIPGFDHTVNQPDPVIVRINLFMEIHDLEPDAAPAQIGFSNVAFHVNFDGLERANAPYPPNYLPNVPFVLIDPDCDSCDLPLSLWEFNRDDGLDKTDLRYILVQAVTAGLRPVGEDPRRRTGQDSPARLGSVFLHWDGDGPASVSVELDNPIGSYYDDDGRSYSLPASQGGVGTVRMGQIPEPCTWTLMALTAMTLWGMPLRKRSLHNELSFP